MVNLTIDGKTISVPKGTTILEAARRLDIHIPTLCWLEKISTTGACRICAVEIEGVDRPMTACNTPVKEGIKVTTQSERLTRTRKQIMELILVNHPLDCPVCDAGGECDLQNTCFELNVTRQEFSAEDVQPPPIDHWPLIQQVPSRCILCEKCVKVCHEIVGADALFVNSKGDRAYIDKNLEKCIFCGNCVAVCPTGTMISKPFKFKARPWTLRKVPSVCTYCPSQCEIDINVQHDEVYRVTSTDGETTNNGTLCIGGFFGHDYINSKQRLREPKVEQKPSSWDNAFDRVVSEIRRITEESGAGAIAGLASPRLSNEENYLFQKCFRAAIGSNNIDSEARFGAMRALRALDKGLGLRGASNRLDAIGSADAILLFGADPTAEAPAVEWQIRKAAEHNNAKLVVANMRQVHLSPLANTQLTYRPGSEIALAAGLGRLLMDRGHLDMEALEGSVNNLTELQADLAAVNLENVVAVTGLSLALLTEAADLIGNGKKVAVIFGADICKSSFGTSTSATVANLAILSGALHGGGGIYPLAEKGNTQGVLDMGVYPESLPGYLDYSEHKERFGKAWGCELPDGGLDADGILQEIEAGKIRLLYLAATNPQSFPNSGRWLKALEKVEVLIVQDIFPIEVARLATVVLPGTSFAEKASSFTSLDQTVRRTSPAIRPVGESREDLEIFAELFGRLSGSRVSLSKAEIFKEINELTDLYSGAEVVNDERRTCYRKAYAVPAGGLKYQLISVSEEAAGLQLLSGPSRNHFGTTSLWATAPLEVEAEGLLNLNPADAAAAGVSEGDTIKVSSSTGATQGKVKLSTDVPQGLIFAPYHFVALGIQQLIPDSANRTAVEIAKV